MFEKVAPPEIIFNVMPTTTSTSSSLAKMTEFFPKNDANMTKNEEKSTKNSSDFETKLKKVTKEKFLPTKTSCDFEPNNHGDDQVDYVQGAKKAKFELFEHKIIIQGALSILPLF
jgi:hypothetical protein